MPVNAHPSAEVLSDYVEGRLPERELATIATHIETCDGCQQTLSAQPRGVDPLLADLAHLESDEPFATEPELKAALANARRRTPADASAARTDELAKLAQDEKLAPSLTPLRDYQILEPLGRGGMGVVYQARHTRLDRLVALKVLPTDRMRRPEAVERFAREMRAVGKLDHPNIVRAFDAGEVDGKHFLVMELVDGIDLSALAARVGPMPIADACELIRQAAVGLDYAHRHGLIHRDVKPSNIILGRDGVVKVLDLGLARLVDELPPSDQPSTTGSNLPPTTSPSSGNVTDANHTLGTPDYMAPEQLSDSRNVDGRNDIYSLGATLYRLLAGRPPYSGIRYDTFAKKLQGLASDAPAPVTYHRRDLPTELVALLDRMLARNPADRPASPSDVAAALAPFARGHQVCETAFGSEPVIPVDMPPSVEPSPTSRWPKAVTLLLLACIATGIVALIAALQMRDVPSAFRGDADERASRFTSPFGEVAPGDMQSPQTPPQAGTWELTLPAGFVRPVDLLSLGGNDFVLRGFGNADGVYRWDGHRLVVVTPDDKRYFGLVWARDGDELVLVGEPPDHPSGAKYVGARLRYLGNSKTSIPAKPPASPDANR
jgi:serine/threonine protein kinase